MSGEEKDLDSKSESPKNGFANEKNKSSEPKTKKTTKDKKAKKMTAGIDPKLAAKFADKSAELKDRIYKEQLEDRIRHHTVSPVKTIVPGIIGILLVITCIIFFSSKAEKMMGGIDPATAPRIKAEGLKAEVPENAKIPIELTAVENAFYTDTPDDKLLLGGRAAVEEQKKAVNKFNLPVEVKNEIGMHFRLIPPGKFIMGSPETEEFRSDVEFQHLKNIKVPFYIGKTEVTVKQWLDVMGHLPHNSQKNPDYPVTGISLNDSLVFVQQLNKKLTQEAGFKYYVISEEEWEYACRAGTETPYFYGHYLLSNDYAVFKSSTTTHNVEPVGQKLPNPWGLYDIIGNAMEWTRTPYFIYACGENQYAGINTQVANETGSDLQESSWDIPVYDGEHPENLVDLFDKFDVPMRAFGANLDTCYWDLNNNKKYDNHEPIWKDSLTAGTRGVFDPDIDVLILTFAKQIPAGTKGEKEGLYYYDKDLSTDWSPGESFWARDDVDRKYNDIYSMRGAAYNFNEEELRSACRFYLAKQNAPSYAGLRIVIYLDKFVKK